MKKWMQIILVMAVLVLFGQPAFADVGLTGKIGTLGYGADLTVGLTPNANLRAGFNIFSYEMESDEEEAEIQAEIDWQTIAALFDWHPASGGFRISAGLLLNNNEILLSATPGESVEINDVEYLITDLNGKVSFNDLAPYLGIGFGNAASENSRWHFSFDLGVMFQGEPKISINATAANPGQQAQLDANLEEERKDIEDESKPFNIYPVLSFGLSYTF